jgi:hypothetical protein
MAKVKEIEVSVGYTINAGNYQSVRVQESVIASLEPGDTCSSAIDEARDYLKKKVLVDAGIVLKELQDRR